MRVCHRIYVGVQYIFVKTGSLYAIRTKSSAILHIFEYISTAELLRFCDAVCAGVSHITAATWLCIGLF